MSVVISHSLFCKLGESDSRLHSTLGHPHDAQIKNRVNINLGTIKEGVPEAASCCTTTIALQLTPGLRLVLDGHPPATIDFMADLVTKWLDDAIITQPLDGLNLIRNLLREFW